MSKRLITLLLALSIGLNIGVIATTLIQGRGASLPLRPGDGRPEQGPPPEPGQLVENHLQGMTQHLGLDEAQQQGIHDLLAEHAPLLIEFQSEVARSSRELSEAFAAPKFDPTEFRRLATEVGAARARLDSLSAVMLIAEAAVLSPPQRVLFSEVAPTVHSNPRRGLGRDGPPPPGGKGPPRPR